MRFFKGAFLGAVLIAMGGATCQSPVVPVIIEAEGTDKCAAACAHLQTLGCPEGAPLEDGTTCEKFCVETQKNGQPLNPACILTIKTCSEIETCTRSK